MKDQGVGKTVLGFYKILPFNYYKSIAEKVKSIIQLRPIEKLHPLLRGLVSPCKDLLEIARGSGWLINSIANNYDKKALGLDFSPYAIEKY